MPTVTQRSQREAIDSCDQIHDRPPTECECMLCDLPFGKPHEEVRWRLVWLFERAPARKLGEATMLMCDHCVEEWLGEPEFFGGRPVRVHPI